MIEYAIIVQHTKDTKVKPKIVAPSDESFHETVFRRSLRGCTYKEGERIKIRGTSNKGVVEKIYKDLGEVNWIKNRPHYILCHMDSGKHVMCSPTQLKRSKR